MGIVGVVYLGSELAHAMGNVFAGPITDRLVRICMEKTDVTSVCGDNADYTHTHTEHTTISHHSWFSGWFFYMCVHWPCRVHRFTVSMFMSVSVQYTMIT